MSPAKARRICVRAWEKLKTALAASEQERQTEAWHAHYRANDLSSVEDYILGSMERFALLLHLAARHTYLPGGGSPRVLDAGAGYGMQAACFAEAGWEVFASDVYAASPPLNKLGIQYRQWNLEADPPPFEANFFDAVILSQTIEHFTYSPRKPLEHLINILRPGGILVLDAPNIASLRNVWRLLRGKTIMWSLYDHWLAAEPRIVHGVPYYDRHNREYSRQDFLDIARFFGLDVLEIRYYSPIHPRKSWPARLAGRMRDLVPFWRKGICGVLRKPAA